MTRSRKNTERSRRPQRGRDQLAREFRSPALSEIRELLANQQTSSEPNTRDVIVGRIRRNAVYTFEQVVNAVITSSITVESDNAYSFSLSQLTNNTSFTTIFDTYRIVGIVVKFFPASGNVGPPVYTVLDYDDANTITVSTMQTYETLKIAPAGAYFERHLTPRVALAAYSGTFTSYAQMANQWLDCASPNINHYGIKIDVPVSATPYTWNITIVYKIQFKNTR